jgi:TPR repeat protein
MGMNFQKKDIPGGQLMIVESAAAGFPMAVAHCHLFGLKHGKKRKRETDINYKKRRVKAGKQETDMNYKKRRLKTAFKMLVTIEKEAHYHWSQYFLGVCYDNGLGTKKNYTKAVEWYSKSSEQKNPVAMNNLAACYQHGEGVDEDKTKGFELYEQSALLGFSAAMYNVGYCYKYGVGVTKDLNNANEWYTKAAAQGNTNAQTQLDLLNAE